MTRSTSTLREAVRPLRRTLVLHRRLLALVLVTVAALSATAAVRPAATPTVPGVVAARDLPAGSTLDAADLEVQRFPEGTRPAYVVASRGDLEGRVLAVGVRRGEPLGSHRLAGGEQRQAAPGLVTVPVRIADAASLLAPGDVIDLLASGRDGEAVSVARGLPVLGAAGPSTSVAENGTTGLGAGGAGAPSSSAGDLVLLGVPPLQVEAVVGASAAGFLFFTFGP